LKKELYNSADMHKNVYAKQFEIKYCDCDFKDELKLSSALAYLEEVACASADSLGFGYSYVKAKDLAFIISSVCCEFYKPIHLGEKPEFVTWPLPPSFAVFGREYEIRDVETKSLLGAATSRWCLIDRKAGKIVSSKAIEGQDYSSYKTDRALAWNQWKILPFDLSDGTLGYSLRIANSEYDHNMHVNNTRYADYCLNCFSLSELSSLKLKRFQISYLKQCYEGDELRFYRKETSDREYTVLGVNQKEDTVVVARFNFEG